MTKRFITRVHFDGPDKLVVESGGTLAIKNGATVEGVVTAPVIDTLVSTAKTSALSANQGKALKGLIDANVISIGLNTAKVATNQVDSVAVDFAALLVDFNALLAKLKAAGLMAADA